jgi:hypothetical protein
MMRFKCDLGRLAYAAPALFLAAAGSSGCQEAQAKDTPKVAVVSQAQSIPGPIADLAEQCGLDVNCEAGGIAEGNAKISSVPSVDAFFASVINFKTTAASVSGGIDAELQALRADFGIAANADLSAEIQAQITANVEGSLTVEAEPARCSADVSASLDAKARCEAEVDPGSATVMCEGSCEVEASADVSCDASADLKCTVTAPSIQCMGECKGSCEVMLTAAASCSGTCKGSCSGNCSAYASSQTGAGGECAGKCDGMCQGSCEAELAAGAQCMGSCKGECTMTNPSGGCEGGIRASCEAQAGAMVMCDGRCEGNIEPPSASAECEASVKAEAKMNVQCTPPRLAIDYELRAVTAAIENLKVRLPALLVSIKRANLAVEAGAELGGAAQAAIMGAFTAAGEGNARVFIGLACAVNQIGAVGTAVTDGTAQLQASITAAGDLTTGLGL